MALSGSTNFSLTRDQLIYDAMEIIGVYSESETPTAYQINSAARSLDMMIKAYQGDGLQLVTRRTKTFSLVSGTSSYTLGPSGTVVMDRPIRILDMYTRDSNNLDSPVTVMSDSDYMALSNKTSSGMPSQYYYDPQLTNGILYIWPVTNTSGYTAVLRYVKPYDDMDSQTNDFEFPQEAYEMLVFGLAARLSYKYNLPLTERDRLMAIAERMKLEWDSFDIEPTSIFIQPDNRYGS